MIIVDGNALLDLLSGIQKSKRRCLAVTLGDVENEFQCIENTASRAKKLNDDIRTSGKVNTHELTMFLDTLEGQLPNYESVRKIILDNINDLTRNIFQMLIGDVES